MTWSHLISALLGVLAALAGVHLLRRRADVSLLLGEARSKLRQLKQRRAAAQADKTQAIEAIVEQHAKDESLARTSEAETMRPPRSQALEGLKAMARARIKHARPMPLIGPPEGDA